MVSLLIAATMRTSVFCPQRFWLESRPMSRMWTTSPETETVGKGVGVNNGVGVRVGVRVGVTVLVGVMVEPGGRSVPVTVAVADGPEVGV